MEIGKLSLLNELDRELTQRIDDEFGDVLVARLTGSGEQIAHVFPNARPLQTNAPDVVVGDLQHLLQREQSWLRQRELFAADLKMGSGRDGDEWKLGIVQSVF